MTSRRAQTVLEFMMTYGWAILIVLLLLVVLVYIGVLNPRGSVSNTCLFSPGYSCYTFKMANGSGALFLDLGQATGKSILVTSISCSGNASITPQPLSSNITIPSGEHRWLTAGDSSNYYNCTDAQGNNLTATSAPAGERYKGKICIGYVEPATGTTRTVCGDVTAMFDPTVGGAGGGGTPTPTPTPIPISLCTVINTPGTYALISDIATGPLGACGGGYWGCIVVNADNVVLNCNNHLVSGSPSGGTRSAFCTSRNNIVFRNCRASGFDTGVSIAYGGSNNIVENGQFSGLPWFGIALRSGANNIVRNNTVSGSNYGIDLRAGSGPNTVANNTVSSCVDICIYMENSPVYLYNNTVCSGTGTYDFYCYNSPVYGSSDNRCVQARTGCPITCGAC